MKTCNDCIHCEAFKPKTVNQIVKQYNGEQKISDYFVEESYKIEDPAEVLNWYRNLYYKEADNTERGVMARALNRVLPELVKLRKFADEIKKTVGDNND